MRSRWVAAMVLDNYLGFPSLCFVEFFRSKETQTFSSSTRLETYL
jgi:hypothetical protein